MANNAKAPAPIATATRVATSAPANAYKYGVAHNSVPCGQHNFTLTAKGAAAAAALAAGAKATVPGIMALAAQQAGATQTKAVNGAAIVLAMRSARFAAMLGKTKAGSKYAKGLPCRKWCSGYVMGYSNPAASVQPMLARK